MRNFVPNEHDNGVTIYSEWRPGQRVLVNGGAGFLGSHLCERLLSCGHEVICLDDLSTGRTANVAHLRDNKRFLLVEHDVRKPYDIDVSLIFNFASPADRKSVV